MTHGVGHCFLTDAQNLLVDSARAVPRCSSDDNVQCDTAVTRGAFCDVAQCRRQVMVIEQGRAQVPERLPALAHIGFHLSPQREQSCARAAVIRRFDEGFALQCHTHETLQQGVMQLATQPNALTVHDRQLPADMTHAQAPCCPCGQDAGCNAQADEPGRPIERGLHGERPR